jgi:hypothetical protein
LGWYIFLHRSQRNADRVFAAGAAHCAQAGGATLALFIATSRQILTEFLSIRRTA